MAARAPIYASLFRGIAGFDLALQRSGFRHAFSSEIESNCNAICRYHWPHEEVTEDVRNVKADGSIRGIDLLCGGFPCQDLSVAGKRAGLAGERSGLFFEFMRIAVEYTPTWVLAENVPGLLSSNGGRDFARVIGHLSGYFPEVPAKGWKNSGIAIGPAYGVAWRVLDAQYFGLAQRRKRVFIVGCLGDWRRAAKILFEPESVSGDSPPSRETGARIADGVASCLNSGGNSGGFRTEPGEHLVATTHTLSAEGHDASEDGTGRCTPIMPIQNSTRGKSQNGIGIGNAGEPMFTIDQASQHAVAYQCHGSNVGEMGTIRSGNQGVTGGVTFVMQERMESENINAGPDGKGWTDSDTAFTLEARSKTQSVAYSFQDQRGRQNEVNPLVEQVATLHAAKGMSEQQSVAFDTYNQTTGDVTQTLRDPNGTFGDALPAVSNGMQVRRLLPIECEKLQGFPPDFTKYGRTKDGTIKEISDSARYRALGNAVAVPVVQWIIDRIKRAIDGDL